MEKLSKYFITLVLLSVSCHVAVLKEVKIPSEWSDVRPLNAGIDEGGDSRSHRNQTCSPVPDYLGESENDVLTTPGIPVQSTGAYEPSTATTMASIDIVNNLSSKNTDNNIINEAALSTVMGEMRKEISNLYESVHITLRDFNATLQNVQVMKTRDTQRQGHGKKQSSLGVSFQVDGPVEVNSDGCPDMFKRFHGKNERSTCLWFSNITGSWAEAFIYCRIMGSELAILNNWVLHGNVTNYMMHNASGGLYYLGGTDYQKEGQWRWLKPKKHFPRKYLWKQGQPDNADNAEHCLAMGRYKRKYAWTDVRCDRRLRFICQKKP